MKMSEYTCMINEEVFRFGMSAFDWGMLGMFRRGHVYVLCHTEGFVVFRLSRWQSTL